VPSTKAGTQGHKDLLTTIGDLQTIISVLTDFFINVDQALLTNASAEFLTFLNNDIHAFSYLQSTVYTIEEDLVNYPWGGAEFGSFDDAAVYFLWDENYLYICAVNKDDTPYSNLAGNWQNDAAELWFHDENLKYKIHAAADGNFFLGADGDGRTPWDFAQAKHEAAFTEDGWCVEVALPLNSLDVDRWFGFSLQVNNILDENGETGYAAGSQNADYTMKLVAEKLVETPVVEEPVVEAPVVAPQTFDAAVLAVLAVVTALGGAVVSKKRH